MKFVLCFLFVGIFTAYFLSNAGEVRIFIFWIYCCCFIYLFFHSYLHQWLNRAQVSVPLLPNTLIF